MRDMQPREFPAAECDHMRPLVSVDGVWRHVGRDGVVLGPCGATSVYRVTASYVGNHDTSTFIGPEETDTTREDSI